MPRYLLVLLLMPLLAAADDDPARFDGSFRFDTGEVITGGYMVENGKGYYVYLDVDDVALGGVFEALDGDRLRSTMPDDSIELTFESDPENGRVDALLWRQRGEPARIAHRVRPHDSRSVTFDSADGTTLAGRLLVPRCSGPHPLVVSVHGSGPVDRHGAVFHLFFLRYGIAVLAYDKRGYTPDEDAWREPDYEQMSQDAAAGMRFAAAQPGIDPDRLGYFGSSQAGWVVPRAATLSPETDFILMRVGPGVSSLDTILHETRQEQRAAGLHGLDLDQAMALRRLAYELAMAGRPIAEADALAAPWRDEAWYRKSFGNGPISELWSKHWWQWAQRNLAVSPEPDLARFGGPVLWFLAEHDENVPLVASRSALERAFRRSPGDDQQVVVVEDVPHSFIIPPDNGGPAYTPDFFAPMAAWLEAHGMTNAPCAATGD